MNISLNRDQEKFIINQMKKGKYANASEVISAAFKVLEEKKLRPDELSKKTNDNQMAIDDYDDKIILNLMKISEFALDEYWLNEQENEAWKNL